MIVLSNSCFSLQNYSLPERLIPRVTDDLAIIMEHPLCIIIVLRMRNCDGLLRYAIRGDVKKVVVSGHSDLDNSVFVSLSLELFCFDYVLYSFSYAGSRDPVSQ